MAQEGTRKKSCILLLSCIREKREILGPEVFNGINNRQNSDPRHNTV
jgi:hypothetical protein